MNKTALVPIAEGSEEIELVSIVDVLRRAGVEVTVASANSHQKLEITASRGMKITADVMLDDCAKNHYDLIAVPGGLPGSEHLAEHPVLDTMLRAQADQGKLFAAICAAPALVLASKGLLLNKTATCYPSYQQTLEAKEVDAAARVVVDGNCITSQGPGTALDFALELVEQLCGVVKREEVGSPMVLTTTATAYY
jgi:4-methyl-5(b-hydroxyethyl)-thiazole monophosphate biosynthesis|tara:strand:+ start:3579 stop:4163 length:585 start_codon:yes stop_codon:yes gene_type:complete